MVRTTRQISGREGCDPVPGWVARLSARGQLGEAVPLAWDAVFRTIHHEPCGTAAEPVRYRTGQSSHQKLGVALLCHSEGLESNPSRPFPRAVSSRDVGSAPRVIVEPHHLPFCPSPTQFRPPSPGRPGAAAPGTPPTLLSISKPATHRQPSTTCNKSRM